MNTTLSIPLATSWTNATVRITSIPSKAAPLLNNQAAWRHPSGDGFYTWGGVMYWFGQPPPLELWKFTADGRGGGAWSEETPRGRTVVTLSQSIRTIHGAWTQSRDVGYFLGGYANTYTDTGITGAAYLAPPGIMALNMTSGELTNSSTVGLGANGTLIGGAAQWAPFRDGGAVLVLGGGQSSVAMAGYGAWTGVPFDKVAIYEPKGAGPLDA